MELDAVQVIKLAIAAALLLLSGLFSGLNLGLMSYCDADLQVVINGGTKPSDVESAKRIQPIRKRGNLLLCTLLLGNTLVNAVMTVLLADMTSGLIGTLLTTALIVAFGEILPQSVCSRHALYIGAKAVPIVWFIILLVFPIAFPISLLLDKLLGQEMGAIFSKSELLALISMNQSDPERRKETGMSKEEGDMLKGALTYEDKLVHLAMTPADRIFSISVDDVIDKDAFVRLLEHNHTRVPVFDSKRESVVALLYSKDLLGVGFERNTPVRKVLDAFDAYQRVCRITRSTRMGDAFRLCKARRTHMLIVTEDVAENAQEAAGQGALPRTLGIITMEDILEQILQQEIIDEFDAHDSTGQETIRPRDDPLRYLATISPPAEAAGRLTAAAGLPGMVPDIGSSSNEV
mmetsp:Transcript_18937/g.52164  ORF Transcript_18937/g.52164 Transcript_18937/m.52164 type:complete len:405 (+) Transcript_18937:72-1286(+)